jgi:hypothetical protein
MPDRALLAAIVLALTSAACDDGCGATLGLGDEAPAGPPRCEPDSELTQERHLKSAWRALAERDMTRARALFDAVLAREPGHPEALRGLALLDHPLPCEEAPPGPSGAPRADAE